MSFLQFKKIVYGACQQLGGKARHFYEASVTPNFHTAEIKLKSKKIFLLCSTDGNWALSQNFEQNTYHLIFVDFDELSKVLKESYSISLLTRKELMAPFSDRLYLLDKDIKYWKPKTLGEALFNWWD